MKCELIGILIDYSGQTTQFGREITARIVSPGIKSEIQIPIPPPMAGECSLGNKIKITIETMD